MGYLLHGQNSLLVDERLARLCAELDPQRFNSSALDLQSASLSEAAAACQAPPFFGGSRVVILRNPVNPRRASTPDSDDIADTEAVSARLTWPELAEVLRAAPRENEFIVVQTGTLASNHGAHKLAKELGWSIENYQIPRGSDLLAWVSDRAQQLELTITEEAQRRLLHRLFPNVWEGVGRYNTAAPDTRLIATELEKLASGFDRTVDVADVDALVEDRAGYQAFELNNALFRGNVTGALVELEKIIAAGDPAERTYASLSADFALHGAALLGEGAGQAELAKAAEASAGRLGALRDRRRPLDARPLQRGVEAIRHADVGVKTGQAGSMADADSAAGCRVGVYRSRPEPALMSGVRRCVELVVFCHQA